MRHIDRGVPLGIPPLRQWDLDENSTKYDRLIAAPSDEDLHVMWSTWGALTTLFTFFIGSVLLAIGRSRETRTNVFNLLLCFLMGSDFIFNFLCTITCNLNAVSGHYFSPWMCNLQSFYCVWTIGSSVWMNAVITRHIHRLLLTGKAGHRYVVPSKASIIQQSLLVYLYNALVASVAVLPPRWGIPHQTAAVTGLACLPTEYNLASTLFLFLVFLPLILLIPLFYILYVAKDIYSNELMPPTGRRRLLVIFFSRIFIVLLVFWLPFFLVFAIGATPWINFTAGLLSHLQGPVTAIIALFKPDTKKAYINMWMCQEQSSSSNLQIPSHHARMPGHTPRLSSFFWPRSWSESQNHTSAFDAESDPAALALGDSDDDAKIQDIGIAPVDEGDNQDETKEDLSSRRKTIAVG